MQGDRRQARDRLLARTERLGLVVTVLSAAATGGVAGALAHTGGPSAQEAAVPPSAPPPEPRPRRTVYVQVPRTGPPQQAGPAAARRAAPPRAVAPPQRTRQAPVTRSDGS